MAFLEQFGKKITLASQGIVQQTKNLTDLTTLNSMIVEKEKKLQQAYASLGKAFFNDYGDNQEFSYSEIAEIRTLQAEIKQCYTEIQQIKRDVVCQSCGAQIQKGVAFCNACGAKVETKTEETSNDTKICPKCGKNIEKDNNFCVHCGAKFE